MRELPASIYWHTRMRANPSDDVRAMTKCLYCGKENAGGDLHCSNCGTPLSAPPEPQYSFTELQRSRRWGQLGLILSIVCLAIVVVPGLPVFFLSAGTPIRPMGWAALSFGMAILAPVTVFPCVALGIKGGRKLVCVAAVLLALAPLPVARMMLSVASRFFGIVVEQ